MSLKPLEKNILPPPLSLKNLIGPSFIILGLGLGSGEVVLWPYLTSKFGMGIIWGALLGLTFQFFMNMEIERYALVNGESVFVGLARKLKWLPIWFVLSTFLPWIWPGIIASSATLIGSLVEIKDTHYLAIGMLLLIGVILSFGPVLYKTVEKFQKMLIIVGVPSVFFLAVTLAEKHHWVSLGKGMLGIGDGYMFLPEAIPVASFLAALAYAGAGGNLNLAQSFYIKEKGYGMGKYSGRITSLLTGKTENISLTGTTFENTEENIAKFKRWWKNINIEHFIVFWITGSITILLLGLLAFVTTYGKGTEIQGINFVIEEANQISKTLIPFAGTFFLIITGLTLFGTQLTVLDATSRILAENIILSANEKLNGSFLPKIYYLVLWFQIAAGIVIFLLGFTQPLQLLTLAAVLNAFAMFIHVGLTLWLNKTSLQNKLRPSGLRTTVMVLAFLFYGGFSIYTIVDTLF